MPRWAHVIACIAILAMASPGFISTTLAAGLADHDSSLPIDIEADRLDVEQDNELAIFSGNVDVNQGDMNLKSDLLKVFYALGEESEATGQAIKRIEADGNVFITSPEETAQGDVGVYDLLAQTVVLTGNVVLTQGDNVIRGSKLNIDLATSVATVVAGDDGEGGRVKALFVPATSE